MATTTTTPEPQLAPLSERIAAALADRESARSLLALVRTGGDADEIALAEGMVKDALKAYRQLVPAEPKKKAPAQDGPVALSRAPTPQEALSEALGRIQAEEARKPTLDPRRLSGTEMRRKAAATAATEAAAAEQRAAVKERTEEAVAAAKDKQVGAYLEPLVAELLADQVLRKEALRFTRRLIAWLADASNHCATQQPALADKLIRLAKAELVAQEQALRDADTTKGAR